MGGCYGSPQEIAVYIDTLFEPNREIFDFSFVSSVST